MRTMIVINAAGRIEKDRRSGYVRLDSPLGLALNWLAGELFPQSKEERTQSGIVMFPYGSVSNWGGIGRVSFSSNTGPDFKMSEVVPIVDVLMAQGYGYGAKLIVVGGEPLADDLCHAAAEVWQIQLPEGHGWDEFDFSQPFHMPDHCKTPGPQLVRVK